MKEIERLYQLYLNNPHITKDSREVPPNSIYFALSGENFNGNKFAKDALKKGASVVVIDDEAYHDKKDDRFFLVKDALKALQDLARFHRSKLEIPIIGITGSNGKTTTKELVHTVISKKYHTQFTKGNYNNHIGVPLTILSIQTEHEIAIIEMGANHQKEIAFLCTIAQPNHGLITNIGKAHLEGFGGVEGIKRGKSELYDHLAKNAGRVFINHDDQILMDLSNKFGNEQVTYGSQLNDYCIGNIVQSSPYIIANWSCDDQKGSFESSLYGDYNFTNIMAAVCIGNYFKVEATQIDDAISSYKADMNRSQLIQRESNTIYLDAYNANPSSMKNAILHFKDLDADNKVLILGDMFELGKDAPSEHLQILKLIDSSFNSAEVILVGKHFNEFKNEFKKFDFYETTDLALKYIDLSKYDKQSILIKGSRGMKLESLL